MQFQISQVITALLVLNTGLCLALGGRPNPSESQAQSLAQGTRVISASCKGRVYNAAQIYNTLRKGQELVKEVTSYKGSIGAITYRPKIGEKLPFKAPYYFSPLDEDGVDDSRSDLVVFTQDGKIAKIVATFANAGPNQALATWGREQCQLNFDKTLSKGKAVATPPVAGCLDNPAGFRFKAIGQQKPCDRSGVGSSQGNRRLPV